MIFSVIIIPALVMSAAGSMHCAGMCGPLALRMCGMQHTINIVLYGLGKTFTYGLLGACCGMLGSELFSAKWQQHISVVAGTCMMIFAMILLIKKASIHQVILPKGFTAWLAFALQKVMELQHAKIRSFLAGLINGMLPCGLVWLALAASLAFHELWQSIFFMLVFGLGTMPIMMLLFFAGRQLKSSIMKGLQNMLPFITFLLGALVMIRGLALDMPWLSPAIKAVISCH